MTLTFSSDRVEVQPYYDSRSGETIIYLAQPSGDYIHLVFKSERGLADFVNKIQEVQCE